MDGESLFNLIEAARRNPDALEWLAAAIVQLPSEATGKEVADARRLIAGYLGEHDRTLPPDEREPAFGCHPPPVDLAPLE